MKIKSLITFFTFCFVVVTPVLLTACFSGEDSNSEAVLPLEEFIIRTQEGERFVFKLEVARTPEEQLKGLMHRTYLPEDEGMAFPAKESKVFNMWMKDTKIPLDMVFVDSLGEIRHIHWDAEPYSEEVINSQFPSLVVLELHGGIALEKNIKPGDFVFHPLFKNMDKVDDPELPETAMDRLNAEEEAFLEKERKRVEYWENYNKELQEKEMEDSMQEADRQQNISDAIEEEVKRLSDEMDKKEAEENQ